MLFYIINQSINRLWLINEKVVTFCHYLVSNGKFNIGLLIWFSQAKKVYPQTSCVDQVVDNIASFNLFKSIIIKQLSKYEHILLLAFLLLSLTLSLFLLLLLIMRMMLLLLLLLLIPESLTHCFLQYYCMQMQVWWAFLIRFYDKTIMEHKLYFVF